MTISSERRKNLPDGIFTCGSCDGKGCTACEFRGWFTFWSSSEPSRRPKGSYAQHGCRPGYVFPLFKFPNTTGTLPSVDSLIEKQAELKLKLLEAFCTLPVDGWKNTEKMSFSTNQTLVYGVYTLFLNVEWDRQAYIDHPEQWALHRFHKLKSFFFSANGEIIYTSDDLARKLNKISDTDLEKKAFIHAQSIAKSFFDKKEQEDLAYANKRVADSVSKMEAALNPVSQKEVKKVDKPKGFWQSILRRFA